MEYKKATNLLDNTQNYPSKFRTKYWIEKNVDSRGMIAPIVKSNLKLPF